MANNRSGSLLITAFDKEVDQYFDVIELNKFYSVSGGTLKRANGNFNTTGHQFEMVLTNSSLVTACPIEDSNDIPVLKFRFVPIKDIATLEQGSIVDVVGITHQTGALQSVLTKAPKRKLKKRDVELVDHSRILIRLTLWGEQPANFDGGNTHRSGSLLITAFDKEVDQYFDVIELNKFYSVSGGTLKRANGNFNTTGHQFEMVLTNSSLVTACPIEDSNDIPVLKFRFVPIKDIATLEQGSIVDVVGITHQTGALQSVLTKAPKRKLKKRDVELVDHSRILIRLTLWGEQPANFDGGNTHRSGSLLITAFDKEVDQYFDVIELNKFYSVSGGTLKRANGNFNTTGHQFEMVLTNSSLVTACPIEDSNDIPVLKFRFVPIKDIATLEQGSIVDVVGITHQTGALQSVLTKAPKRKLKKRDVELVDHSRILIRLTLWGEQPANFDGGNTHRSGSLLITAFDKEVDQYFDVIELNKFYSVSGGTLKRANGNFNTTGHQFEMVLTNSSLVTACPIEDSNDIPVLKFRFVPIKDIATLEQGSIVDVVGITHQTGALQSVLTKAPKRKLKKRDVELVDHSRILIRLTLWGEQPANFDGGNTHRSGSLLITAFDKEVDQYFDVIELNKFYSVSGGTLKRANGNFNTTGHQFEMVLTNSSLVTACPIEDSNDIPVLQFRFVPIKDIATLEQGSIVDVVGITHQTGALQSVLTKAPKRKLKKRDVELVDHSRILIRLTLWGEQPANFDGGNTHRSGSLLITAFDKEVDQYFDVIELNKFYSVSGGTLKRANGNFNTTGHQFEMVLTNSSLVTACPIEDSNDIPVLQFRFVPIKDIATLEQGSIVDVVGITHQTGALQSVLTKAPKRKLQKRDVELVDHSRILIRLTLWGEQPANFDGGQHPSVVVKEGELVDNRACGDRSGSLLITAFDKEVDQYFDVIELNKFYSVSGGTLKRANGNFNTTGHQFEMVLTNSSLVTACPIEDSNDIPVLQFRFVPIKDIATLEQGSIVDVVGITHQTGALQSVLTKAPKRKLKKRDVELVDHSRILIRLTLWGEQPANFDGGNTHRSGSLLITAFDKEVDQYFDVIELNKFYSVSGGTLKRANGNFNTTGHQFEMVLTNSSLVTACPIEDSNDIPVLQFRFVPIKDIATLEQGSIVDVVGITHQTGALQSVLTKAPKRKLKKRDVELVDHSRILIRLTLWGEQPANFDGGQHPSVVVKEGELVDNRACGDRSGSLLITAFDKEVDQYFDVIELNKFYSVSGGTLKRANGNFNTTGHQFEMVLTNSSLVTACPIEDSNDIPVLKFRFVPIKDIATLEQGSIVDVVGITHQTGALQSVLTKAPKRKLQKRDVELVDHSRILIRLTLWGEQPANFDGGNTHRSGSLLITAFDKEVDQYFDVIELNKFYSVSGGTLKRANGNFNTTGHQFEMVLTNSSLVTACPIEDSNDIPVLQFRFVPIKDIATLEQGSIVDVVGITHQTGALQSVLTKAPKRKLKKRDVELVDHSRILIRLTLWGEQPANFDGGNTHRSGSLLITAFDKEVDQYFDVIELNKFYSVSGGTLKRANGNFNTTGHQFEMVLTNSSLVTACPIEDSNDIPVLQFRFVPIKDIATLEQGSIVDVVGITHQTGALQSVLTKAPKRKLKKRDVELVDHSRILIRLTLWGEQPANFDGGQHPSVVVKEGELVDNRACGDRSGSLLITAFDKEVDQYFDVIELNKFYSVSGGTLKRANGNFNTTGHQFEMVLTNSSLVTACPIEDSNDIPVLQFRFVPIKDIATLEQGSIVDVVGITHQTGALQSVLTKAPKRKLQKRDVELVDHSRILIRLTLWGEQPANFDGGNTHRSGSLLITAFDKEVDQYFDVIELNKFYSVSGGTLKRANGNFNTTGHQFEMVLTNSSLVTACPIEDSNDIPVLKFRFVPIKDIATLEQGSIVDVVGITHQTGALQSVLTKAPKRKLKKRDVELVDHSRILIRLTLWGEQPANFDGGQHPSVVVKEGELVDNRACGDRSGSLLITAFDKEVDQYFDVIELNKFYSVSGGTLKRANGNFNTTGHQFEMVLTNSSLVTACPIEDSNDIPVLQFRFVPIKDIATLEQGSIVDVVGITHQTGALQSVLTKAPKRKLKKRDVELVDHSRILIRLTLWGEQPANFDGGQHPSVVVKEGELVDNRACGDRSGSLLITAFDKEVDQYFDVIELNKFYSVSGGTLKRANGNFNTTGHQFEMVLTNSSLVTACPIEDSNDIPVLQFRFVPIKDIATLEQGSIVDVVGITHQTGALQSVLTKAPKRKLQKRDVELVDHSRILIRLTLWGEQPANFDGGNTHRSGSLLITAFDKEVDQYFDVIELNKFYSVSGGTLKRANGNFNTTGHQFEMVLTNSSLVTACPIEDSNDIPVLQFRFVPIKDIATLEQGSIVDVVGITHQTGALQSVLTKAPKRKLKKRDVELVDHSRILIRLTLWGEQPANFDGGNTHRSGSLLITAFDKEVDQYFDVIELNKFYSVSGGTLKRANGNFNTTGHQFEMVLTNSSLVTACPIEDSNDIPVLQFRFVPIKDIATLEQGSIVDVVGITHQTGALQSVLTKAPKRKLQKRDVELVDHSRILIRLTLWGEQPANFDGGNTHRSGSLLITAFDKEVDQYFDVIELNKFYSVSGGTLKRANGNFNTTGHQFEMVLTNSSLVTACPIEDSNDIPVLQFRFVPIKDIATLEQGSIVDVVGITHQTGALQSVLTKAPKRKLKKRDVELVDHSRILIRLTLWGEQPANFDGGNTHRSGSLLITAFDKEVDQYFDVIELNKFYSVSGGTLKRANGNFNTTGHQFEMVLTNSSLVTACPIEDSNDIPVLQFRFVPIKDIATLEQGSIVDVVGITHQTGALQSVLTKAPKRKLKKRDVELVDHSRILIRLTLWGEQPANFDGGQHPSVVVKEGELVDNRACGDRSGSLLITAFDKEVDQYFDVIELNKFYSVSGGTLKRANGNFNTTGHQFEMVLTNSSLVTACPIEDSNDIPVLQFRFVPIKDIATLEQGSIVDVVGITHQTGALQSVLTKAPKRKLQKRDVELVDHSRILIRLTLWGEQPANFDGGQHPSVVVKEGELVDNRACGDRSGSLLITAFDKEVDQYFDVIELNKFYSVSGGTLKRANGNFNTTGHQFEMVLTNSSLVTACPIEDSNDIPVLQFRFVPIKDIATLEQGSIVDVVGITHQTGALQSVLTKAPKRKLQKRDVELVDHSRILIRLTLWGEQPANFDGGNTHRSGSLLITAFDKEVDQYFDVIELNKFYSVSGGTLKRANGNFNTTGHQFEMVLTNSSLVTACPIEDSNDIPVLQFRFVPIKDIATLEQGSIVDVVGITHQTGALQSVLTKAPKRKLQKRDVELVDHSRILIRLTLWGEQPANFDGGNTHRSGSLLITAFDKEVDQYFDVIELNKFYLVSGGTLKRANGNFNTTGHQFEMVLTNSSLVTACPIEDSNDIPVLQFRFVPIKDIATLEQGSIVDVVGITHQTGALQSVLTKAPKRKLQKRDVELVDHSRILIRLTLWGEQPANFDGGQHPSVVVKEGELVDCGDRSGSLLITAFDKEVDQYFDVIELNKFYSVSGGTLKRANGNFNTTGHQFEMVLTNSSLVTACPIEDSNDIPVLQFRFVPIKDIATLEQGSIVDVVGITHQTGALQSVLTKAPKRKLKKRDVELVDHSRILIRLTLWGEQPANFDGRQHPSVVVKEGELVDCGDRSGSLLITAFDKEVDQYFDVIELNKFYSVSGGTLKRANGNFNTTGHQFEMVLTNSSLVTACPIEDSNDIPVLQFRFVPIKDIATLEQGSIVDVVGITHQTGALQSVLTKAPKRKLQKRDVELVDHSRILIRLTLWGEQPANFDGGNTHRSGSLLITAFDKEVDQYFDVIELNKFYSVSGGTLKRANGNFNTTGHQFEMVLTNSSLVTACPIEDSNDIPVLQFRFVPIKDIATLEQGSIVDVVGITHQTGALQSVLTKAPKRKLQKRDVELVDHSRILIRLTLWGEQPANFDGGQHPSVVVKEGELVDNRACGGNRCGLE
ncbi:unnamed protein product [Calicophoron daubneyi]|uniref:Replication protein A OB domain-containing protein n=1 Tax=Calicophoron daubneyi TaxID=300641 RepID=A0AAV2TDV7_CALDB